MSARNLQGLNGNSSAVGVLELLGLAMFALGTLISATTSVPFRFDLWRALSLLGSLLVKPFFLTALAGLSLAVRRSSILRELDRARAHRGPLPWPRVRGFVLVVLLPAIALACCLPRENPATDRLALLALATLLYLAHRERKITPAAVLESLEPFGLFVLLSHSYSAIKAAVALRRRLWDAEFLALDRLLLGTDPASLLTRFLPASIAVGSYVFLDRVYYAWLLHFLLVFGFLMASGNRAELRAYVGSIVFSYHAGSVLYHVLPAMGPAYYHPQELSCLDKLPLISNYFRNLLWGNWNAVRNRTARRLLPFEYIACMPSLHVAAEFVMLFFTRSSKLLLALSVPFFVAVLMSTVALGWHYVVDWLGGLALAFGAIWLALRLEPRLYAVWARPASR